MFERREISARRRQSWHNVQVLLAALTASLALAVIVLRTSGLGLGLDTALADQIALVVLYASLAAALQLYAWGRIFRRDL